MGCGQTWRFLAGLALLALMSLDKTAGQQQDICEGQADILVILDSSGSVDEATEYQEAREFIAEFSARFTVTPTTIRFAAIVFGDEVRNIFGFNRFDSNAELEQGILGLPYLGGLTFIGAALRSARTFSFTIRNGARPNVPKIALIITDGVSSNATDTQIESTLLKQSGVTILTIGIGNTINQLELEQIASSNDLIFNVGDFSALSSIRELVAMATCDATDEFTGDCISSCVGRSDGNYPACGNQCESGIYLSCSNQFTFVTPCPLGVFTDSNGNNFAARLIYNPVNDTCQRNVPSCERDPADSRVPFPNGTIVDDDVLRSINNPCLNPSDSCAGRPDGNYPLCPPACQSGFYYRCSNGETFQTPCPLGNYSDTSGNTFTARTVFDTSTDTCELFLSSCPRDPATIVNPPPLPEDPTGRAVPIPTCVGRADILFILDSSASIGNVNYEVLKSFVASLTGNYLVEPTSVQFSVIIFSDDARILFTFRDFNSQGNVAANITRAPYLAGGTNTAAALALARENAFSLVNGARNNVSKVAIVITDGISDDEAATASQGEQLKNSGVTVLTVGIGNAVRMSELRLIASDPELVLTINNFDRLNDITANLVAESCLVQPQPCLDPAATCSGLPDGSYAICNPVCAKGEYFSCVNGLTYRMTCGVGFYRNANFSVFTAPMVFNAIENCCERFLAYCPRNPKDFEVVPPPPRNRTINPFNPPCISPRESCSGRVDGNYPMCFPGCRNGFYFSCRNGETFERPCPLGTYLDRNGNPFTRRTLYDPTTDSCEMTVAFCPREVQVQTTTAPTVPPTIPPVNCSGTGDILFILDASSSVDAINFNIQRNFTANLVSFFNVGREDFLFSALVFSTNASILFDFDDFQTAAGVTQAISELPFFGGGTNTAQALDLALNTGFTTRNAARTGVPKFAVVITDGVSQSPPLTARAADRLKTSGVTVLVIGIGSNIGNQELRAIASGNDVVFTVSGFSNLTQITNRVIAAACNRSIGCIEGNTCGSRPNGNYPPCDPECRRGDFFTCSNGNLFRLSCSLDFFTAPDGSTFTARQVFDSTTGNCQRNSASCPRDPNNFRIP